MSAAGCASDLLWRRSQMIYFVFVTSVLAVQNGAVLEMTGDAAKIEFGGALTLIHNTSENQLTCSGKIQASDVLIEGTSTSVADLISRMATLETQMGHVLNMVGFSCYGNRTNFDGRYLVGNPLRYSAGWALANHFSSGYEECNTLCQGQPECAGRSCLARYFHEDERCYCSTCAELNPHGFLEPMCAAGKNLTSFDGRYTTGNSLRYSAGWALSNNCCGGGFAECNTLCQSQPECVDRVCYTRYYSSDSRCYCSTCDFL